MRALVLSIVFVLAATGVSSAAEPPDMIHFQGVLRDNNDKPVNGERSVVFSFYDADTDGTLLLEEHHPNLLVTKGLFNVPLGTGDPTSARTDYDSMEAMFAEQSVVHLEVKVNGSKLTPRIRVASSAYALNAHHLDGRDAGEFIDTSSTAQTKTGPLTVDAGITAYGSEGGGYFEDTDESGHAWVGRGNRGIWAYGTQTGGLFEDLDGTGMAWTAIGNQGIEARGSEAGGYFWDYDSSGRARVAVGNWGIEAWGSAAGGFFRDNDSDGSAFVGSGNNGIDAYGTPAGRFTEVGGSGFTRLAVDDYGIRARGAQAGGYFYDSNNSGLAYVGFGDIGIDARGAEVGGLFNETDSGTWTALATDGYGVEAHGTEAGASFSRVNQFGCFTVLAAEDLGIHATCTTGGHFESRPDSGDLPNWAELGTESLGIQAYGEAAGGRFSNSLGTYTFIPGATFKISGNGSGVAFEQNHPEQPDQMIVYAAPEGDEIATYTRGTARLDGGRARVSLGETFKWVTNPDIGLTAYVTPHGDCAGLFIESLSTNELIVGELNGGTSDVAFDYIVYGLRVGFEEIPVLQERTRDAYLPLVDKSLEVYERRPELRQHNPLERFRTMRVAKGESSEVDLSAAMALRDAIGVFDPAIHGTDSSVLASTEEGARTFEPGPTPDKESERSRPERAIRQQSEAASRLEGVGRSGNVPVDSEGNVYGKSFRPSATDLASLMPVAGPVEAGDVLVIDPEQPGNLGLSQTAADARVFGIVAGEPGVVLGSEPPKSGELGGKSNDTPLDETVEGAGTPAAQVPVALSGLALCKVDAGYGAISPGDLLTTSPTPGHAMRSDDPIPGTILGKALQPLDTGTGSIRVLVMLR